jgi:molecular chaperone GrpE (heat shock protein)
MNHTMIDKINQLRDNLKKELTEKLELRAQVRTSEKNAHKELLAWSKGIIEIIDNINSKNANLQQRYGEEDAGRKVLKSYRSVPKQLISLLAQNGITKLTFPENRAILGFCKIVGVEPDDNLPNETIITVVRDGYIRGSECIREAELIVVKN